MRIGNDCVNERLLLDQLVLKKFVELSRQLQKGYSFGSLGYHFSDRITDREIEHFLRAQRELAGREIAPGEMDALVKRLSKYYVNSQFRRVEGGFGFDP